jgi:hypothetical protein
MKQIYRHGDKTYVILKRVLGGHFAKKIGDHPNTEYIQMYRDWIGADHVLRDQTHFMFCETIPDIEFEEIKEEL